jgi:hypothetical protein
MGAGHASNARPCARRGRLTSSPDLTSIRHGVEMPPFIGDSERPPTRRVGVRRRPASHRGGDRNGGLVAATPSSGDWASGPGAEGGYLSSRARAHTPRRPTLDGVI